MTNSELESCTNNGTIATDSKFVLLEAKAPVEKTENLLSVMVEANTNISMNVANVTCMVDAKQMELLLQTLDCLKNSFAPAETSNSVADNSSPNEGKHENVSESKAIHTTMDEVVDANEANEAKQRTANSKSSKAVDSLQPRCQDFASSRCSDFIVKNQIKVSELFLLKRYILDERVKLF